MQKYTVIIEKSGNGFGAYVPDLPGCVALGDTMGETYDLMQEAIRMHIETMISDGDAVPEPNTYAFEISA